MPQRLQQLHIATWCQLHEAGKAGQLEEYRLLRDVFNHRYTDEGAKTTHFVDRSAMLLLETSRTAVCTAGVSTYCSGERALSLCKFTSVSQNPYLDA
jgi:hypothetical protein